MVYIFPVTGPVVSEGFWTLLSDWIGANSFDHANKDARWKKFFSNTDSAIAQELESEIDRATRLWLGALQPPGRNLDKKTKSPFYNRLGVGKLSFGVGIQKLQKAFFGDIKRSASVSSSGALERPRSMTHAAWPSLDATATGACGNSFWDVLSPSRGAAPFRLAAYGLAGHVGDTSRNRANSAQCSVDKYGHKLQTVAGAKGSATQTLHGPSSPL
jgi:hypothetical protein